MMPDTDLSSFSTPLLLSSGKTLHSMAAHMIQSCAMHAIHNKQFETLSLPLEEILLNRAHMTPHAKHDPNEYYKKTQPVLLSFDGADNHPVLLFVFPDRSACLVRADELRHQNFPSGLDHAELQLKYSIHPIPFTLPTKYKKGKIYTIHFENKDILLKHNANVHSVRKATFQEPATSFYHLLADQARHLALKLPKQKTIALQLNHTVDHDRHRYVPPCLEHQSFTKDEKENMREFLRVVGGLIANENPDMFPPYRVTLHAGTRTAKGLFKAPKFEFKAATILSLYLENKLQKLYTRALYHPDTPIPYKRLNGRSYYWKGKKGPFVIDPTIVYTGVVSNPLSAHEILSGYAAYGTEWK